MKHDLEHIFNYHPPDQRQRIGHEIVRKTAKSFAKVISEHVPDCEDRQTAILLLRQCVAMCNAAIALKGKLYLEEEDAVN